MPMFEGPIGDSAQEEDPGNGRRFGAQNLFRIRFAEFIPQTPKAKPLGPLVCIHVRLRKASHWFREFGT